MQIQTQLTLIFAIDVVAGGRRRGCVNSLQCDMQGGGFESHLKSFRLSLL